MHLGDPCNCCFNLFHHREESRRALKEANRGFDTIPWCFNKSYWQRSSLSTKKAVSIIDFSENGITKRYVSKPDKIVKIFVS